MTEREFAEDVAALLTRGLIEIDLDLDHPVDEGPRFQPTAAGRAEITSQSSQKAIAGRDAAGAE